MKNSTLSHKFFLAMLSFLLMLGCTANRSAVSQGEVPVPINSMSQIETNTDFPSNLSLADHLRKVSGLIVVGNGNNVNVRVRGVKSLHADNEPLYVLDGTPVGTDYAMLADAINPNDIKSIRLLKGSDATLYGTRGANGVILIRMNIRN